MLKLFFFPALALFSALFHTQGKLDIFDIAGMLFLAVFLVHWALDADAELRR